MSKQKYYNHIYIISMKQNDEFFLDSVDGGEVILKADTEIYSPSNTNQQNK